MGPYGVERVKQRMETFLIIGKRYSYTLKFAKR